MHSSLTEGKIKQINFTNQGEKNPSEIYTPSPQNTDTKIVPIINLSRSIIGDDEFKPLNLV